MSSKWTISAIKAANKAAGQYFFEPGSMRFFNSIVERTIYQGQGGVYFVTSEQFLDDQGNAHPRKYTVRRFNPDTAEINSVTEFYELTREQAVTAAKKLAKGDSL